MDKIPNFKSFKRAQRWLKAKRERRALEAIMAACMKGFTTEDWKKVYDRIPEIERRKQQQRNQDIETDSWKIYGA